LGFSSRIFLLVGFWMSSGIRHRHLSLALQTLVFGSLAFVLLSLTFCIGVSVFRDLIVSFESGMVTQGYDCVVDAVLHCVVNSYPQ